MSVAEYVNMWKKFVYELKGEGAEANALQKTMIDQWGKFSEEERVEAGNRICKYLPNEIAKELGC